MELAIFKEYLTEDEYHMFIEKEPIWGYDSPTEEQTKKIREDEELMRIIQKVYDVTTAFYNGELTYSSHKTKEETGQRVLNINPSPPETLPIMTFVPNISSAELEHLFEKEEFTHTGPCDVMVCLREGDTVEALCLIKDCMVHDMYEEDIFIKDTYGIHQLILDDLVPLELTVPGEFSEDEERPDLYRVHASPDVEMVTYDTDIRNVCSLVHETPAGFYLLFEKVVIPVLKQD